MTRETLLNNLKQNLSTMTLEEFAGLFINKMQAVEEFYKLTCDKSAGKTISLLFNPHRLDTIGMASSNISIYGCLSEGPVEGRAERIDGMARLYLYNLQNGVNDAFYQTIQRGFNGVQYINEFPPIVARTVYKTYGNGKENLRVLDPCCGWGGRMIGCASIPNTTYVGCEPSTKTYEGLLKLGEWLKSLQPTFNFEIHNVPYEEFVCDEKFDIALTSPPYYDTEKYSDEETNSLNKFKTFDLWVDGFYKPLIINTMNRLNDKAVFILNVGDRQYPLSDKMQKICEDNGYIFKRVRDYLSGNGELKEKFYMIAKEGYGVETESVLW